MQPVAEKRNSPAFGPFLQQICGPLRLIDSELKQMSRLGAFYPAWSSLRDKFAGHHETESIALFGFFQVVGRHEHRRSPVSEAVDHAPERASRKRIHP